MRHLLHSLALRKNAPEFPRGRGFRVPFAKGDLRALDRERQAMGTWASARLTARSPVSTLLHAQHYPIRCTIPMPPQPRAKAWVHGDARRVRPCPRRYQARLRARTRLQPRGGKTAPSQITRQLATSPASPNNPPMPYNFTRIEKKWQDHWLANKTFRALDPDEAGGMPKAYILDMFPYPSGAGLHVGHPEGYTATDIVSRYLRDEGVQCAASDGMGCLRAAGRAICHQAKCPSAPDHRKKHQQFPPSRSRCSA